MKRDMMFEHVVFGKEDSKQFFLFKGVRAQRLPISQQITATLSFYKRK